MGIPPVSNMSALWVLVALCLGACYSDVAPPTCYDGDKSSYTGNVNVTESGIPCQPWASHSPHSHHGFHNENPGDFPDGKLPGNLCRSPPGDPGERPWCYTMDATVRWEHCAVYECDSAQQESDSMVPEFTYFDARARGEVTRMLFAAAGRKFVDIKVDFYKQWPGTLKDSLPFHQLPILNVSGHIYSQSIAIQNFVARETDLYGRSSRDQLMIDQISYAKEDLFVYEETALVETDPVKQAELNATLQAKYPIYLGNFAKFIKANPDNSGFVIGRQLSAADIIIHEATQTISQNNQTMLDQYPDIVALWAKVANSNGLKQYLATRKFYLI